jgi:putative transposase
MSALRSASDVFTKQIAIAVDSLRVEHVPKRVERTFAWLGHQRRLSKECRWLPRHSETWIYAAMSFLMARRLTLNP